MPSTDSDRQQRWGHGGSWPPEGKVMDELAISFLRSRGFTLEDNWTWTKPYGRDVLTPKEIDAIVYLIEEWMSMEPTERELRHKIFEQADFGALIAGQYLPKESRKKIIKANVEETT